jgi:hypothetical protein
MAMFFLVVGLSLTVLSIVFTTVYLLNRSVQRAENAAQAQRPSTGTEVQP